MRKIEDVLRLHAQGLSTRRISLATGVGKTTVIEYLRRAEAAGLSWPAARGSGRGGAGAAAVSSSAARAGAPIRRSRLGDGPPRAEAAGTTLALLWDEYRGQHPDGYGYSAFCERYSRWTGRLSPVMRQRHAAGERMLVDYSGTRMTVTDPATGAARPAEISSP